MLRSEHIVRNARPLVWFILGYQPQQESNMKNAILVATCVAALSAFTTGAFAQSSTGPAAQQDTMSKDKMAKDGMKKEGMGTTGMNNDSMSKDGMAKKDMSKDGSPSADTMKKKGTNN
jgi:pentapeptide MXKDX repeat protein